MSIPDIKYSRKKMKSGLGLVLAPMPGSPTVTLLVIFKVGSRYEPAELSGISHFLEHIVSKGNKLYKTSKEVSTVIDGIGGIFNAFTTKEYTGFHVKVGTKFASLALHWLGALVTTPLIPKEDVNPERNVILEEINMYNDTPARQVDDTFEELLFAGSSLGRNIIGNKKSLSRVDFEELRSYFKKNYIPSSAVLVIAGDLSGLLGRKKTKFSRDYREIEKKVNKDFNFNVQSKIRKILPSVKTKQKGKARVQYKKTDQTHLILGAQTFSLFDKRRYPLALLSTIMGSGMSSWAFTEVREKRGLAYYVHSLVQLYQDVGYYSLNAGLNNDKISLAITEIAKLFKRIREKPLSLKDLKKAKDQVVGGMLLERETSSDVAFLLGSEIVSRGTVTPFSEEIEIIRGISRGDLKRVAEDFFASEQLRLACIGPWRKKDEERFSKLLK